MLTLNHDNKYDILSIYFDRRPSYADESYDGIEVFHDIDTDEITGLLIYDFLKRYRNGMLNRVAFPVQLDIEMIAKRVVK
jgi:hypothetical protein